MKSLFKNPYAKPVAVLVGAIWIPSLIGTLLPNNTPNSIVFALFMTGSVASMGAVFRILKLSLDS